MPISIIEAKIANHNRGGFMLQYALLIALLAGVLIYGIGELGQTIKGGFDSVNTAITLVEDINKRGNR